jgi:hypothetical protein
VDAITLDRLLAETAPAVVGRHLLRPRLVAADAVAFEVAGQRDQWLWLDAGRGSAGIYRIARDLGRRLAASSSPAATSHRVRQAFLHLRKHTDGARVSGLERVEGERTLVLRLGETALVLRIGGAAPALTLAVGGQPLGTIGEGREAWPPPAPAPDREWSSLDPDAFAAAVAAGRAEGRSLRRAVLAACPGLGPVLARELDGTAVSFAALRARLAEPRPVLLGPGPPEAWTDALLLRDGVSLSPVAVALEGRVSLPVRSWTEAAALFLEGRRRGVLFEAERRAALDGARRAVRRLEQLQTNLVSDLRGLAAPEGLRRQAETLLAFGHAIEAGAESVELPDPWDPGQSRLVALDPRLTGPANAERLFEKARRAERAGREVELRLRETRAALAEARAREAQAEDAHDAAGLPGAGGASGGQHDEGPVGPRHYLTACGLSILVGRGARENHHLTFRVARPEDLWLHARDVPGAHVILRDPEGRAGAEDLREAAEVAAFYSEAREAAVVDVHVTRRKHLRPGRGGPGRVFVSHSDTLRVRPRDPEGRLRSRLRRR